MIRCSCMDSRSTILVVLLMTLSGLVFSQQKSFVLNWENNKIVKHSNLSEIKLHGFQTDNFIYDIDDRTLLYADRVNLGYTVSESNFVVKGVVYETLSEEALKGYNVAKIKSTLEVQVKNAGARGKNSVYVQFNPIIKTNGLYKKVTSLNIIFQQQSLNTLRTAAPPIGDSSLATGQWYRFFIDKTGVYKLDKNFLAGLGVDVNSVNPQNIRLFGNGGKAIPLLNADVNEFDVTENAVKFVGEQDGVFNDQDYILFYGVSALGWDAVNNTNINPYSDKTFYYINVGSVPGRRIQPMVEPSGAATTTLTTFNEYQFHEVDQTNIVRLGRKWFGENFDINNNQSFGFSFPKIDTSQPVQLKVAAAAAASNATSMQVTLNGQGVDTFIFPAISAISLAREDSFNGGVNVASGDLVVDLIYNNAGNPGASAYLDFISIEAVSNLRSDGRQFDFKNNSVATLTGIGEYVISNASDVSEVWDVTDIFNVTNKTNTNSSSFAFKADLGEVRDYVALIENDFYAPRQEGTTIVDNLNLKGTIFLGDNGTHEDIDYLIVTPSVFKAQADRLADINRQRYNLRVKVVELDDIYSEFNTGNQDIGAIRNFVRYVYQNGVTDRLKYVCLFGDASYDMKDREPNNTNFVPTYHTLGSFSLASSYMSDDFFGMMDENEGNMAAADQLDIAVGRMVASSSQQANELVTKVQQYHEREAFGSWRNKIMIVSDDVDLDWEASIQRELDILADEIVVEKPFLNVVKIHSDAYLQESSAGGELYPKATEDMISNLQLGVLVNTYFGHGGEDGLAHERLFQKNDAEALNNICKYNLFITVTCEFTRFDNPFRATAGEFTYWNPEGGAIALITTTREIFVSLGINFNKRLAEFLFDYADVGYHSNAEALRLTKNSIPDPLRRVVFYVGDPAMKLAIAEPGVRMTAINDVPITDPSVDTLEALGRVKISGEIVDGAGNVITDYNGKLSTVIYDKKQDRETLANDGTTNALGNVIRLDYETLGEIIFRGQSTINNDGTFDFEFVVPRDIAIPVGDGRISFYAQRDAVLEDHNGYNNTIKIGGINTNAPEDNLPPQIQAFMNDESFVSGGTTNESPFLLLKLQDENGINTASGIGHDITAILDGDEANPYILNDYYETEPDDFTRGNVSFQFRDLSPGLHTLTIKAWDVYNNSGTTEIQFVVVNENDELVIERVLNYPNPFVNYTEFWFSHNSSTELDVMVQIYTVSGKLIKTLQGTSASGNKGNNASLSRSLTWDGKDDFGDKIGKGVYVYKLTVRSPSTNKETVKFEKLVIL